MLFHNRLSGSRFKRREGLVWLELEKAACLRQQFQTLDFVSLEWNGAAWPASCLAHSNQYSIPPKPAVFFFFEVKKPAVEQPKHGYS